MEVNRLLNCFREYSCDGGVPKKEEVVKIVNYLNKGYYEQILNSYPSHYAPIVLKYFEDGEEYEVCQKIVNRIKVHNHISSSHISTYLPDCN